MSDVLTLNLSWMIFCAGEYLKCILLLLLLCSIFIGGCHFIIRVQKVYCTEDMVTALKQLWSYIRISSFAQEFLNFIFFNLCLIFARLCFWTRKNFLLFGSIKLIFIHSHYVCEKMTGAFIWFVKFIMQCHFCYWLWEKHEKFKECDEQGNKRYLLRLHILLYFRLVWVSSVHYWLMLSLNEFLLCYIILLSSFGMFLSCFWCLIYWMH